jgi:hypothetical protein
MYRTRTVDGVAPQTLTSGINYFFSSSFFLLLYICWNWINIESALLAGKELLSSLPGSVAVMEVPHKHFTEMPSLTVGNYRTIYFSSYVRYRKKYYRTY